MAASVKKSRVNPETISGGLYFPNKNPDIQFIPSGCTVLDLALGGGGWARRRISNIVGDRSTGKTLIAIEMAANFALSEPKGNIRYREAESAFDDKYAAALGFPVERVDRGEPIDTIDDLFEDMSKVIEGAKGPELYIVDSLDALSDRDEMERAIDKGSYCAIK
jgi:recombination protein RecA